MVTFRNIILIISKVFLIIQAAKIITIIFNYIRFQLMMSNKISQTEN